MRSRKLMGKGVIKVSDFARYRTNCPYCGLLMAWGDLLAHVAVTHEGKGPQPVSPAAPVDLGPAWVPAEDLPVYQTRREMARVRGVTTPGSVYYPHSPPDDDDFWQWCVVCAMWHTHGPCF